MSDKKSKYFQGDIRRFKNNPEAFAVWTGREWVDYAFDGEIIHNVQEGKTFYPPNSIVTEDLLMMDKTKEDEIDFCNILKKND